MNLTDKIEKERKKVIAVDLDGTLTNVIYINNFWDIPMNELGNYYLKIKPNIKVIRKVNELYAKGFIINVFTSRWDLYKTQTKAWLDNHNVKYHELHMNKPFYDFMIDDKALRPNETGKIK